MSYVKLPHIKIFNNRSRKIYYNNEKLDLFNTKLKT